MPLQLENEMPLENAQYCSYTYIRYLCTRQTRRIRAPSPLLTVQRILVCNYTQLKGEKKGGRSLIDSSLRSTLSNRKIKS
jgi:hypothetical protein